MVRASASFPIACAANRTHLQALWSWCRVKRSTRHTEKTLERVKPRKRPFLNKAQCAHVSQLCCVVSRPAVSVRSLSVSVELDDGAGL